MNLRFSLKQLLIVVALASVACAALAQPGYWWHATIATVVAAAAVGMLIAALVGDHRQRTFAVGWLVLAVGYLAVAFGPWTSTQLAPQLLSTKGLAHLERKWHGDQSSPLVFGKPVYDFDGDGSLDLRVHGYFNGQPTGGSTRLWAYNGNQLVYQTAAAAHGGLTTRNYTLFQATAHWMVAALLGYWGGILSMILARVWRTT